MFYTFSCGWGGVAETGGRLKKGKIEENDIHDEECYFFSFLPWEGSVSRDKGVGGGISLRLLRR